MKRLMSFVLSVVMLLAVLPAYAYAADGLKKDSRGYYLISTADDLYSFAQLVNSGESSANAKLTADIVINENVLDENGNLNAGDFREWYPIADKNNYERVSGSYTEYNGIFDGQNYSVSGLYYSSADNYRHDSGIGLFGTIGTGTVKNVAIKDSYINACYHIGSICGYLHNGSVLNCSSNAVLNGSSSVGGLVGFSDKKNMVYAKGCNFSGKVFAVSKAGGIIGASNYFADISYCSNYGEVNTTNSNAGGIIGSVGDNSQKSSISCCANFGNVNTASSSYSYIGGIASFATNTDIINCLNVGIVTASSDGSFLNCGGICGYGYGSFSNCLSIGAINILTENEENACGAVFGSAVNNTRYSSVFENNYYLTGISEFGVQEITSDEGVEVVISEPGVVEAVSSDSLKDGTVLSFLNENNENSPWVQNIGADEYPVLQTAMNYCVEAWGGSIRITDAGLRFGFAYNENQGAFVEKYGFVFTNGESDETALIAGGENVFEITANNRITHENNVTTFNLVFTDIPKASYNQAVSARAYVVINGVYYYSDVLTYSFKDVAEMVLNDNDISADIKNKIQQLLNV